ncbi:MAG: TRAP transporter small permease subunit [Pseudomonadota bacterium]
MAQLWSRVLAMLAGVGGAIFAGMFVAIVVDVTMRAVGLQPPLWTGTYTEFGLLYATMLAAPWLIGRDGHIRVRAMVDRMPAPLAARIETVVLVVLAALCALLAVFAFEVARDAWARGEVEYRSVILPRWILFAPMPLGFGLSAIEFARLALSGMGDRSGASDAQRSL